MSRTSAEAVRLILGANYDGTSNLTPFIETAGSYADELATRQPTSPAARLELIERWLAAWCYTQMDPLYASKATASASGSFRDQDYKGVALSLDPTGTLAGILSGGMATGAWLGKTASEQRDYCERVGYR